MKKIIVILSVIFCLSTPSYAHASEAEGLWLTENKRSVIHIQECGNSICGKIHWIIDGGMQTDAKNPDTDKKKRPMCGLDILWDFKSSGKHWSSGKIYKADDGDIYSATITIKDANTLSLRGYLGIPLFGKTQTWTRVSEDTHTQCTP